MLNTMNLLTNLIEGSLICLTIGLTSYYLKMVDLSGFIAGMIVGVGIFTFGGPTLYLLILLFHLIAGFATHLKMEEKQKRGVAEFKGGARRWQNVLANGLIPTLASIAEAAISSNMFIFAYVGAVSAGLSDTLSNEIGVLNPTPPRIIINLKKKVPPGTPGGVSPLGMATALLSPMLIGIPAYLMGLGDFKIILASIIAGFTGSVVDSIVGGSIQGLYKCKVCGKITEREIHCGVETELIKGHRKINNHVVNLIMSVTGALTGMLVSSLI